MATYNGERYILPQMASILGQLPGDAEIVIADDGSTDATLVKVQSLGDDRIRILPQVGHLGPTYNFERALKAARGDVIFLADQDDVWNADKVSAVLAAMGPTDRGVLVVHDAEFMGSAQGSSMWGVRPIVHGVFNNWLRNSYTGCCMAFTRKVLEASLPFPKNLPMHDQWIGLVAERSFGKSGVVEIKKPLMSYRIHENNATNLLGRRAHASFAQRLLWRLNLLRALWLR